MRERQIEARERNAKEMEAHLDLIPRSWALSHRFWLKLKELVEDGEAFHTLFFFLKLFRYSPDTTSLCETPCKAQLSRQSKEVEEQRRRLWMLPGEFYGKLSAVISVQDCMKPS